MWLEKLFDICDSYCTNHNLTFNVNKSSVFRCSVNKKCGLLDIVLNRIPLNFVSETKYLGVVINDKMKSPADIYRQERNMYAQSNMLIRNFMNCNHDIQCLLLNIKIFL